MIRYRLKDQERQTALEKIFPGFGEALQAACEDEYGDSTRYVEMQLSDCNGIFFNDETVINKDAITTEEVYDPHAWNRFPEVTPPEGVWMRCEGHDQDTGMLLRAALVFDGKHWKEPRGDTYWLCTVERFRPWDDEEAAK